MLVAAAVLPAACGTPRPPARFVATIPPLGFILREIVRDTGAVAVLLPPGASPHTYEPRPSDAAAAQGSAALVFDDSLLDGWAARLAPRRRIEMFALVPAANRLRLPSMRENVAGAPDPHFWTDPTVVGAIIPALTDSLCAIDAPACTRYRANAAQFTDSLRALDTELAAVLGPLRGRAVVLFHPSFQYLLARYGIRVAAVVEPAPGKEPTPRDIEALAAAAARAGATTIFTEPQLPRRPAEVIAEVARLHLAELDPLGGTPGRDSYAALLRYNAAVLRENVR